LDAALEAADIYARFIVSIISCCELHLDSKPIYRNAAWFLNITLRIKSQSRRELIYKGYHSLLILVEWITEALQCRNQIDIHAWIYSNPSRV